MNCFLSKYLKCTFFVMKSKYFFFCKIWIVSFLVINLKHTFIWKRFRFDLQPGSNFLKMYEYSIQFNVIRNIIFALQNPSSTYMSIHIFDCPFEILPNIQLFAWQNKTKSRVHEMRFRIKCFCVLSWDIKRNQIFFDKK